MLVTVTGVALAVAFAGCDDATAVPSTVPIANQRGPGNPRASQGVGAPALPVPGQRDPNRVRSAPAPRAVDRARTPPALPPGGRIGTPATTAGTTEAAPDYSNALRTAFGTPTVCISAETRERLQGTLDVSITVRATPSGRVTSATVSGPGLSSTDTACMTERAENLRLGSIESAPRTISASITFDIASTPGTRSEPDTPEWRARAGAQAPGTVLSAGGTGGRPAGFIPPSSTLPATE